MAGRIRVFIACSLDGFIAGDGGDLSWLPQPEPGGEDYGYAEFTGGVSAMLMGRTSYDAVVAMAQAESAGAPSGRDEPGTDSGRAVPGADAWYYDDLPIYVATSRPLEPIRPTVQAIHGSPADLVAHVQAAHPDGDLYVDGGTLIRSLLDALLIDDLIVTVVPTILGTGHPLFAGTVLRHQLEHLGTRTYDNGLVQLHYAVDA